jgi:predicted nucleic acid-binding Zn ribbon protein
MSATSIARNVNDLVQRFAADGLTTKDYLKAALRQPQLFTRSPAIIAKNITDLWERFAADGLTIKDVLKAGVRQPSLFCMLPASVAMHITALVERFTDDGLTTTDYLKAAVRRPQLFCMSPPTAAKNITETVDHFSGDGLTTRDYIEAALKQPQLFYQSPATIIRHMDLILAMYDEGVFCLSSAQGLVRRHGLQYHPHAQLIAYLMGNPLLLCLDDSNLRLRRAYCEITGAAATTAILTKKRHEVEAELLSRLGHADHSCPVPPDANPTLITLVRDGLIKGARLGLARQTPS